MTMEKQPSIKKNFLMNMILTLSTFVFPLITFPYVSRVLMPIGTGKVAFATSLVSYFNMISQLGIPTYGIRACAKVRDDETELSRTVHELFAINMIMTAVSYIALVVVLFTVPRLFEDRILYFVVSANIILSTFGMEWLYKALEKYTYITLRSIIFKFIALLAMFLLVHSPKDYIIYGGISIFAASASYITNFINVRKYISIKPVGNYHAEKHLKPIFIFFSMACATTIYTHLDTVMLGFMTSDTEVGYYNAAVKIKQILVSIVTSLGAVLLPRSSYYVDHGMMDKFKQVSAKALNFVILFAIPLSIYFIVFAREGVLFLSGRSYEASVIPMQIIMPTLLLIGITNILGIQILIPLGKEKIVLYSEIAGAITDLILNAIMIPLWKASGAAVGTLVAEIVVLSVQCYYLKNEMNRLLKNVHFGAIAIAILCAALATFWTKMLPVSFFVVLLCSSILFFGVYYVSLLIQKEPLVCEISTQILDKLRRD